MRKINFKVLNSVVFTFLIVINFSLYSINITVEAGSTLTPHSPISILSDADFVSLGFPGNGTASEPYIIEGYNITSTVSTFGIQVRSTTAHFIIRNCFVKAKYKSILIRDVAANTSTIADNYLKDSNEGISIENAYDIRIENNTIINCNWGIFSLRNDNERIVNNTIKNSWSDGIYEGEATDLFLANNKLENCGIYLSSNLLANYRSYTLENNTVNTLPILYLVDEYNYHLNKSTYGQLLLINCTDSLIENQYLSKTSIGIFGFQCSNITIKSSTFTELTIGIRVSYCDTITVDNITAYDNSDYSIVAIYSSNISLKSSIISNQSSALFLRYDDKISVLDNTFNNLSNNALYIYICEEISVINNIFANTTTAASVQSSNLTVFNNNEFSDTKEVGLILNNNDYTTVTNNQFTNSGVKLETIGLFCQYLKPSTKFSIWPTNTCK
ncbi:MAG: right-handed parallel beta-helix repeat-containing protein [Candidatus Heimdallarchaeaceae archaeon]